MTDLEIKLHDYSIVLSEDLSGLAEWFSAGPARQFYVITDENTNRFCWPLLKDACPDIELEKIVIPEGESHKNLRTCETIWKELLDRQADRSAMVINLGGGVVGDMGGFAASCFKRGIDFMNIPTTVLSQVDASIGGKLGVDFQYGKNLIGMFRNPKRVHVSTIFHQTLSDRQYKNGFAEIFKHAIIGSREQWTLYSETEDLRGLDQVRLLHDALMIKKNKVEEDPFEMAGRKALNFGHTIGHALEAWSIEHTDRPLLHGEAIAAGMIMESFLSTEKLGLPGHVLDEIIHVLNRQYSVVDLPAEIEDTLWQYMKYDKKNIRDKVMASLVEDIGQPRWNIEMKREDLDIAVAFYKSMHS